MQYKSFIEIHLEHGEPTLAYRSRAYIKIKPWWIIQDAKVTWGMSAFLSGRRIGRFRN